MIHTYIFFFNFHSPHCHKVDKRDFWLCPSQMYTVCYAILYMCLFWLLQCTFIHPVALRSPKLVVRACRDHNTAEAVHFNQLCILLCNSLCVLKVFISSRTLCVCECVWVYETRAWIVSLCWLCREHLKVRDPPKPDLLTEQSVHLASILKHTILMLQVCVLFFSQLKPLIREEGKDKVVVLQWFDWKIKILCFVNNNFVFPL